MHDEERLRVLHMVAAGSISPEEASDVLETLEPEQPATRGAQPPLPPTANTARAPHAMVVIHVSDGEKDLRVCIPTGLASEQRRFLVRPAMPHLEKWDVNLEELLSVADQFPIGTTLLSLSEDERSIEVGVEEP